MDWIGKAIRDLCELPDRTSPEDDPEAIVATPCEIRAVIEANLPHQIPKRLEKKMNFGQAIETLKAGGLVQRAGWNGKGMHLYIEDMLTHKVRGGVFRGETRKYEPCICMWTAQQTHQPGWLASQADMLAEDWQVVTPKCATNPHDENNECPECREVTPN